MEKRDLNHKLALACADGDLDLVKTLVKMGANVNFTFGEIGIGYGNLGGEHNVAFLFGNLCFSGENHLKCLDYLISKGLDINKVVPSQWVYGNDSLFKTCTPIQYAIEQQNPFTIKKFLDNNVDLTTKNENNESALDMALGYAKELGDNKNYIAENSYLILKMLVDSLYKDSVKNNKYNNKQDKSF